MQMPSEPASTRKSMQRRWLSRSSPPRSSNVVGATGNTPFSAADAAMVKVSWGRRPVSLEAAATGVPPRPREPDSRGGPGTGDRRGGAGGPPLDTAPADHDAVHRGDGGVRRALRRDVHQAMRL